MMDERLSELLSRYLDGDLDDQARRDLERRLGHDEALAGELEDMEQLRRAVMELAAGMGPPAELDRVVDPLFRSAPPQAPKVRPVYRWLGAAAALVLGVTIALEVARRNPEPTLQRPARSRSTFQDDRGVFELAPLPSAVPDDDRPVGATDQLLEEQPAVPEAPAPVALEVIGPLTTEQGVQESEEPTSRAENELRVAPPTGPTVEGGTGPAKKTRPGTGSLADAQGTSELTAAGSGRDNVSDDQTSPAAQPSSASSSVERDKAARFSRPAALSGTLVVEGVEVWGGRMTGCVVGVWSAVLEIRDGTIVTFEPAIEAGERCRAEGLIGTAIGGLTAGRHTVQLEVRQ